MSALPDLKPLLFDDEDDDGNLQLQFDTTQLHSVTPYTDHLSDEYQAAQERLRALRQEQEATKRLADELEELSRKEQRIKAGRVDLTEELNRCLGRLEQEGAEARRRAADCSDAVLRLENHLNSVGGLRPDQWSRSERKGEIERALTVIEAAESELDSVMPLLDSITKKPGSFLKSIPFLLSSRGSEESMWTWMKKGFAFFLPLIALGLIIAIVRFFI